MPARLKFQAMLAIVCVCVDEGGEEGELICVKSCECVCLCVSARA